MDPINTSNLIEDHWSARQEPADIKVAKAVDESDDASVNSEIKTQAEIKRPKLWAVGGGKGGVGKSLICANFSVSLAKRGRKVLAVDLDLGGSNLHTCLGVNPPTVGIGDWVFGRVPDLRLLTTNSTEPGLQIVSGSQDPLKVMAAMSGKVKELIAGLRALDFDDVVIDLGAGTADFTTDIFNAADEGILSILPEPTSVENAYRFIRAVFYKRLLSSDISEGIREVVDAAMDPKNVLGIRTPADLLAIVERLDAEGAQVLRNAMDAFSPSIVINQVRSQVDVDVGRAICSVCRRYFGILVKYPGYIDYDNSVWKAVRNKRAVLHEFPNSPLSNKMEKLTRSLLGEEKGIFP